MNTKCVVKESGGIHKESKLYPGRCKYCGCNFEEEDNNEHPRND